MSNLSAEDFISWVNIEHAGSDTINNNDWSTCAIGCYLRSHGIEVNSHVGLVASAVMSNHYRAVSDFMDELEGVVTSATDIYGDAIDLAEYLNIGRADTYGDILDVLPKEYT